MLPKFTFRTILFVFWGCQITYCCAPMDEIEDAFLNGVLGILCDLEFGSNHLLHNSIYVHNGEESILFLIIEILIVVFLVHVL
jgi:hypothetical protein